MLTRMVLITMLVLALTVAGCGGEKTEKAAEADETEEVVVKATDPVCGMRIEATGAMATEYEGETYYFCSIDCKDRFGREPEKFLMR